MNILTSLGFVIIKESIDELRVAVPYHKPDVSLPADLVEEILRIDGLDNIDIPEAITITPSIEENGEREVYREKVASALCGLGFSEIMTNSITNAAYFSEEEQESMVKMTNSLSAELNILRNSLFETALEVVAHNLNHRNLSLRLFEFGKAYRTSGPGEYGETEQLCILVTGQLSADSWKLKAATADFFYLKAVVNTLLNVLGVSADKIEKLEVPKFSNHLVYLKKGEIIAGAGEIKKEVLDRFGIKQPVFYAGLNWEALPELATMAVKSIQEIPRFPSVHRDLAMVIDKNLEWDTVRQAVQNIKLNTLQEIKLFDIFESEKLGPGKKSIAVNFTFLDEKKTLTDTEIEGWMKKIMQTLEKDLKAEIRK
jgi:phenylalanyl-tRNA synthetase beta chain